MPRVPLSVPSTALVLQYTVHTPIMAEVLYPASASDLNADGIDDSKSRTRSGGSRGHSCDRDRVLSMSSDFALAERKLSRRYKTTSH